MVNNKQIVKMLKALADENRLKILKLRDGEHKTEQVKFTFNPETLTMENDILVS